MVWFLRLNVVVATDRAVTVKDLNPTSRLIIWALHVGHVSGLVHSQRWVVLEACCKREGGARNSVCAVSADSSLTACSGVENAGTPQKLLILDARSYTAAVANRAKGGGCECEGTQS